MGKDGVHTCFGSELCVLSHRLKTERRRKQANAMPSVKMLLANGAARSRAEQKGVRPNAKCESSLTLSLERSEQGYG